MIQCPSCKTYANAGAAFCAQCGARIDGAATARSRRRRAPLALTLAALGLLGAIGLVVWVAILPEGRPTGIESRQPPSRSETAAGTEARGTRDSAPRESPGLPPAVEREPSPLSAAAAARLAAPALVVLDLRGEDDRPLREERGVLVDSRGVVLCRYRPLLGAHHGICRLHFPASAQAPLREARVEIRGLSFRDEILDLALIRIAYSPAGYPQVPILAEPPSQVLAPGDAVFLFADARPEVAGISEPYHRGADGAWRVRLAESPPPEAFLVLDAYGYLIGFCRLEAADGTILPAGKTAAGEGHRTLVDPAVAFANALDLEASFSLFELTRRFYDGTFPDLFARAVSALKQKRWREAIDLFEQASARIEEDGPAEEDVAFLVQNLRECYHEEVRRLAAAGRAEEAAALAEAGFARYADDRALMVFLGEIRVHQRNWPAGIQALAQAREIQADDKVDSLLERAYLELAGESLRAGDLRAAEARLLEGTQRLPESGPLQIELAKLYIRIEAFDDAVRLLHAVKEGDPSLRDAADALIDKIDDTLKSRDAIVIPILPNSRSIRTQGVIDGAVEFAFIIDTGATFTAIPPDLAETLGYDLSRAPRSIVATAAGSISVPVIQVASVSVGGYSVRNLDVMVLPAGTLRDVGLLGLNFLKHFKYGVDARKSEFRLERP